MGEDKSEVLGIRRPVLRLVHVTKSRLGRGRITLTESI